MSAAKSGAEYTGCACDMSLNMVMAGPGPAIHAFPGQLRRSKTCMPATSAGMTARGKVAKRLRSIHLKRVAA
jgi:hypothetical protein